jgi:hypothetical protein
MLNCLSVCLFFSVRFYDHCLYCVNVIPYNYFKATYYNQNSVFSMINYTLQELTNKVDSKNVFCLFKLFCLNKEKIISDFAK